MKQTFYVCILALTCVMAGCTTNAVTGKRQFTMPIAKQISIGKQQYQPSLQQQGGRYAIDPELNLYVASVGNKLAAYSPVKLPYEFTVIDNNVPNAWALPGGKIAINSGLLALLDDESQLAAVLGHEIIHAAAEHSARQMAQAQLLGVGALAVGLASKDNQYAQYIGIGTSFASGVWQAKYGRDQELEADSYGIDLMVKAGYDPQGAVELQQTFVSLKANNKTENWLDGLFSSHPPSQERVDKNKALAATLPQGKRNATQYKRATRQLAADQNAESAHNESLKQFQKKNYSEALAQVNSAIRKQPNAAKYYLTKGTILQAQNNASQALKAFDKASKVNPDYFLTHLQKGLTAKSLNKNNLAKPALTNSMQQLSTPIAAYHLSEYAYKAGDKTKAIELLKFAAQDKGEVGKAAQAQLAKLQPSA